MESAPQPPIKCPGLRPRISFFLKLGPSLIFKRTPYNAIKSAEDILKIHSKHRKERRLFFGNFIHKGLFSWGLNDQVLKGFFETFISVNRGNSRTNVATTLTKRTSLKVPARHCCRYRSRDAQNQRRDARISLGRRPIANSSRFPRSPDFEALLLNSRSSGKLHFHVKEHFSCPLAGDFQCLLDSLSIFSGFRLETSLPQSSHLAGVFSLPIVLLSAENAVVSVREKTPEWQVCRYQTGPDRKTRTFPIVALCKAASAPKNNVCTSQATKWHDYAHINSLMGAQTAVFCRKKFSPTRLNRVEQQALCPRQ
ncbi:hypothetical protein HUJ04_008691 [Dendroctonus ponderosae]|nr:hypothetical protein HUJ04_008691 [Dendroctonus ponderosae]